MVGQDEGIRAGPSPIRWVSLEGGDLGQRRILTADSLPLSQQGNPSSGLSQDTDCGSLSSALSILYIMVGICSSQTPAPSFYLLPLPLSNLESGLLCL